MKCLVHDDMCHFHAHVLKKHKEDYRNIKTWVIDTWHRKNHVNSCEFKRLRRSEKGKLKKMSTSRAEQFNSFIRRSNFFLDGLRAASHRFWVLRLMQYFNAEKPNVSQWGKGRSNVASRSRPGN